MSVPRTASEADEELEGPRRRSLDRGGAARRQAKLSSRCLCCLTDSITWNYAVCQMASKAKRGGWRPGREDLAAALEEQNPWHSTGKVPEHLAPTAERPLAQYLPQMQLRTESRRFELILGPRRVGKTTAMYQTIRSLLGRGVPTHQLWWLRLDHPLFLAHDLGSLVRGVIDASSATREQPAHLFLDELTYAKDWDLWLKTFYDEHWPVRIWATSSATAALREGRTESGVGRWDERYLTPYLFSEYLDLVDRPLLVPLANDLFDTLGSCLERPIEFAALDPLRVLLMLIGGFPELLHLTKSTAPEELQGAFVRAQHMLRSDAVERAIYKDIPQVFGVDNPIVLERLLYVLAGRMTGILSPAGICQELGGLTQPTFDKYLSYLERSYLVFTLQNYSGNEASIQKRGRKLYFVDGAVRSAALLRGLAPLVNSEESGHLIENLVASHLHALAQQAGHRLFHWRENEDEVDLILDHPTSPMAFEVASRPNQSRRGLLALQRRHPKFDGRCFLVAPGSVRVTSAASSDGIATIPLDLLLVAVGRHAEAALRARMGC
ncbi:MAG: ATP-binding protein [Planctomycetes bacterium]|nr:ATP-binding protein [Planctomycetota bacterium]